MKKKCFMFGWVVLLMFVSFYSVAKKNAEEHPGRETYEWKKSIYGTDKYVSEIVFSKTWKELSSVIPFALELSADDGNYYMTTAYKLIVGGCGESFTVFCNDYKKQTSKGYRFVKSGELKNIFYNEGCKLDYVATARGCDEKGNVYLFDYGQKLGVVIDAENEARCIDRAKFETFYNDNMKYLLRYIKEPKADLGFGVYNKQTGILLKGFSTKGIENGTLWEPDLLGSDSDLNAYVITRIFRKSETVDETPQYVIYKISNDGKLTSKIYPLLNDFMQPYSNTGSIKDKLFNVDNCGNIYQMWVDEKKVEIIRWSKEVK